MYFFLYYLIIIIIYKIFNFNFYNHKGGVVCTIHAENYLTHKKRIFMNVQPTWREEAKWTDHNRFQNKVFVGRFRVYKYFLRRPLFCFKDVE